jgi:hypothetical protein
METIVLTREMLLEQKDDVQIEKVELSRGIVFVREMSAHERDVYEQSMMRQVPDGSKKGQPQFETALEDFRTKLAVCTLCDESGNLLFSTRDIPKLSRSISASNMDKIVEVAQRLNGISEKDKEEILKNSNADLEKSSNSSSVEN